MPSGLRLVFIKKKISPPPDTKNAVDALNDSELLYHAWGEFDYLHVSPLSSMNDLTSYKNMPHRTTDYLGFESYQINIFGEIEFFYNNLRDSNNDFLGLVLMIINTTHLDSIKNELPGCNENWHCFPKNLGAQGSILAYFGPQNHDSIATFSHAVLSIREKSTEAIYNIRQVLAYPCSKISKNDGAPK
jgi:hypothetical protein